MDIGYTYGGLDPTGREIRLLHLLPGSWEEPLRCDLRVVSFDDLPEYQALSYVWGDPSKIKTIQLHGKPFNITVNLWAALRRLRRQHDERVFWIDAACIDQKDLEERSHQVLLMGEIYSRASQVFVWLGDSISGEDSALKSSPGTLEEGKDFEWLCKNIDQFLESTSFADHESEATAAFGILHLLSIDAHWTDKPVFSLDEEGRYDVPERYVPAWQALLKLWRLPWWSRVWVVQELVLAKDAVVMIGSVAAPWQLFTDFCQSYLKHLPPGACCHTSATWKMTSVLWDDIVLMRLTVWSFYACRAQMQQPRNNKSHTTFWENLWLLRHKAATDARDKVYGLLGLLYGEDESFLTPDYSISTAETFSTCTEALIRSSNNLNALVGPRLRRPDLPTWVMDLLPTDNSGSTLFFQNIFKRITSSDIFNACPAQDLWISREGTKLHLRGFLIDKVRVTAPAMDEGRTAQVFKEWETLSRGADEHEASIYPSSCTRADAFWRTMIRDTIRDYSDGEKIRRATPIDEDSYGSFRKWLATNDTSAMEDSNFANFRKSFFIATQYQQFFTTDKDYMGIGDSLQTNDEIWILFGGNVPFVLRPYPQNSENPGVYALIGDCYIHGIMDGQALKHWKKEDFEEIILI